MKDTTGLSKTDVLMHTSDSIALHSADDQEFFKDFGMQHIIETEIFKITFFEWAQASLHCFARALARIDALEAKRLTMDLKCFRLFGEITVTQDFLASMRKTVINGRERVTTLARNAGFAESLQRVEESGAAVVVGGSSLGVLAQRRGGSATEDLTNVP